MLQPGWKLQGVAPGGYCLHAMEGLEEGLPRYGVSKDYPYYDLSSLVRMYGRTEVRKYLQSIMPTPTAAALMDTVS